MMMNLKNSYFLKNMVLFTNTETRRPTSTDALVLNYYIQRRMSVLAKQTG